jgi:CysZ protein
VGFFRGLSYPFKGLRFVFFQHPGLARFWIFPIVITLIVLGFMVKGVWEYHDALFEALWSEPSGEDFWAGVARFFHGFAEVLFAIVLFVVGLVLVVLLSSLFAAPFNDLLREGPKLSVKIALLDLARSLLFELLYVTIGVVGTVVSWFLPVIGQIGLTVLMVVVTALYWAISYIDWPAARRRKGLGYRFSFAARHFWAMSGFGTGAWVILLVPLLNLFFMPVAVAGGTLLYLDLERAEHVQPSV